MKHEKYLWIIQEMATEIARLRALEAELLSQIDERLKVEKRLTELGHEYCDQITTLQCKLDEAVKGETLQSLIKWGDETFGPCNGDRAVKRAEEELAEYWEETDPDKKAIEAADTIICLLRVPGIIEAINLKMAINRQRTWKIMGDGTGYHIKEAALSSIRGE